MLYGKELEPVVVNSINIMSSWSGRMLTVTNEEEFGQNDKFVKCQPFNTSWTSHDWVIKNVEGKNTVRLFNRYSETYLTVRNQNEDASVICQPLNTS